MTDNELIAEFMGCTRNGDFWIVPGKRQGRTNEELLYSKSWKWLMPVVEKIEGIGYITSITTGSCVICAGSDLEKREDVSLFAWHSGVNYNSKLKFKNTFEAVVEFIKWYNEK